MRADLPNLDPVALEVGEPHPVYAVRFPFADRNGFRMSIGTGKMVVELFSAATSTRVCRKRSCSAIGSSP